MLISLSLIWAMLIKKIVGFDGSFNFDSTKPDGTYRKLTDVSKLQALGWKHQIPLEKGIRKLYAWYISQQ